MTLLEIFLVFWLLPGLILTLLMLQLERFLNQEDPFEGEDVGDVASILLISILIFPIIFLFILHEYGGRIFLTPLFKSSKKNHNG